MDPQTPLVFIHAYPLNSAMWAGQRKAFESHPILTPDLPGFGGRPPGPSTLEGFAGSVLADMDAAGVGKAVVVGLSMGGYVALRIHALAPERITRLVLADTRAGPDDEAGKLRRTQQAERARREGGDWLPDAMTVSLLGTTTLRARPRVSAHLKGLIARDLDPEGVARALEAMRDRPDSVPILPTIQVPVLVVVGEEDTLTPPEEARRIFAGVPGSRLEVIRGSGHLSNLETPGDFNGILQSFLKQ